MAGKQIPGIGCSIKNLSALSVYRAAISLIFAVSRFI
jgi:hypothetical protein